MKEFDNSGFLPEKRAKGSVTPKNVVELRKQLVTDYHGGSASLSERLAKEDDPDLESLLNALVSEMVAETDHLLGNELVSTQDGDLRDATVISAKRAEVLDRVIKAVQSKQAFDRSGTGVDLDSPAVRVLFRYFMEKTRECIYKVGLGDDVNDLFFRAMESETMNWKKEVRKKLEDMKKKKDPDSRPKKGGGNSQPTEA